MGWSAIEHLVGQQRSLACLTVIAGFQAGCRIVSWRSAGLTVATGRTLLFVQDGEADGARRVDVGVEKRRAELAYSSKHLASAASG